MRMSALTKVEMSASVDSLLSWGGQHRWNGHGADERDRVEAGACDPASDDQGATAAGGGRGLGGDDAPGPAADPAGPSGGGRGPRASESRHALKPTVPARTEGPGTSAVRDYRDFGPTLAAEKLAERHGITLSAETVRGWLRAAGVTHFQRRKRPHRAWRARKAHVGELV